MVRSANRSNAMSCGAAYCPGARTFIPALVRPPSGLPITIAPDNRSSPCAVRNLHSFGRFLTTGTNLACCCFVIADAVNRLFLSQGGTRRVAVERTIAPRLTLFRAARNHRCQANRAARAAVNSTGNGATTRREASVPSLPASPSSIPLATVPGNRPTATISAYCP